MFSSDVCKDKLLSARLLCYTHICYYKICNHIKKVFIPGNPLMNYCCSFYHPSIAQNNLLVKAAAERYLCCS